MVTLTQLTKLLLPAMVARGSGRILNVASTAAFQPGPLMAVYYATKAYVFSFSEALSEELRDTGVTVSCLCPGPTSTEFASRAGNESSKLFKSGLTMSAEQVAKAGYDGLKSRKRVIIPGFLNKSMAISAKLSPVTLTAKIARRLQEK
jgi:short-subunit dehydrogenase